MVELSTFLGQIITDLASARTYADYAAAGISEQYHADPFVKMLPIPHYIIDEAELSFPVMVVGLSKTSEQFATQRETLSRKISELLPVLLMRSFKYNYIQERENLNKKEQEKQALTEQLRAEQNEETSTIKKKIDLSKYNFTKELLDAFTDSAQQITVKMGASTAQYIENYNYEILKLLDMSEDFSEKLGREIRMENRNYKDNDKPYWREESILRSTKYLGNLMFFEFKKIMKMDAAVQVDINTVQMNEYAKSDCLMHLKVKIKEQDLNLVVESGDNNKQKRYLSLT